MIYDHRVKFGGKWYEAGMNVPNDEPLKEEPVVVAPQEAPKKAPAKRKAATKKKQ